MYLRTDTIAAIATARGSAALGIVRISGPAAAAIVEAVMPQTRVSSRPRRLISGIARDPRTGRKLDEALCFYCPGPHTATGEDTAEIQGHGGLVVMNSLLRAVIEAGARPAEPGEFTYRSFRNGRMDLTQAEAVMGLIGARSDRAAQVALRQLSGGLGLALSAELDELTAIAAQIEAGLDFPDEDLPVIQSKDLALRLDKIAARLTRLRDSFTLGYRLNQGAIAAIIGPPNAGKSSLFNRLVDEDRALVDDEPGTTRDAIEAHCEINGVPIVFVDTAGLRLNAARLEKQGVEKTLASVRRADLILLVVDGSALVEETLREIAQFVEEAVNAASSSIVAINKADLPTWSDRIICATSMRFASFIPVSALTGQGLDQLKYAIGQSLTKEYGDDVAILTTQRQHTAVASCCEHVVQARNMLDRGSDPELAAADLRWAMDRLAALWGRSAVDEVIEAVFSNFCIGK